MLFLVYLAKISTYEKGNINETNKFFRTDKKRLRQIFKIPKIS